MPRMDFAGPKPGVRAKRPQLWEVLDIPNEGASPVGSTFYKTLMACAREHALAYEIGAELEYAGDPLTQGLFFHHLLQLYYEKGTAGAKEGFELCAQLEEHQAYSDLGEQARTMFDSYLDLYDGKDKWRVIAVEETLIYHGDAFSYSARLDLIVEDLERGGMWVVEHKTARALTAELLDNYQMDIQILGQVWLVRHCVDLDKYPPFKGVRVNITTKHKNPQHTRVEVYPSDRHLAAFEMTAANLHAIRGVNEKLGWPQALGHCSGYTRGYSRCDYFDICHAYPDVSVEQWKTRELPLGYTRGVGKRKDRHA